MDNGRITEVKQPVEIWPTISYHSEIWPTISYHYGLEPWYDNAWDTIRVSLAGIWSEVWTQARKQALQYDQSTQTRRVP